jgi:hypothetical protein
MKKAKRLMAAKIPMSIWREVTLLKYHAVELLLGGTGG